MKPTIYLALTHDWELRGDGSRDIEQIQFAPLRRLLEIYARFGARTTFLPDLMQQLAFRRLEDAHPELKLLADRWDEHLRETFLRGHDVQLHLHPQWLNAEYANGRWLLKGNWSILNYDRESACAMLAEGRQYLENLFQPLDAAYRCVAFRAGGLAAAPSDHLLKSLAGLGLRLDVSTVGGLFIGQGNVPLDYRPCEETFLPYYPLMEDARRVSDKREPIVCVPINHFYGSRRAVARQSLSQAWHEVRRHRREDGEPGSGSPVIRRLKREPSPIGLLYAKLILPLVKRTHFVSDTGHLNYPLMTEMLESIRRRAEASGLRELPVVLTNHPKDIRDFNAIERLVAEVSRAEDIKFITLTGMAEKLLDGAFHIRRGGRRGADGR